MTPTPSRLVVAYGNRPAVDLLRAEAARFHGVPPSAVEVLRTCPRCGSSEHGRPRLRRTAALPRPAFVSISRTGTFSVVAVTDAGPVGVDVERPGAGGFPGFDDVALHHQEHRTDDRARVWTRKEALLKAYGLGLAIDPATVRLGEEGVLAWPSSHPEPDRVWWRDLELPDHVGAVAVLPVANVDEIELAVAAS